MLRYLGGAIVMQEVPDEVSLAVTIAGCIHRCPDCHSKYSWADEGRPLLEHLPIMLKTYSPYITCFCMMGGDQDQRELIKVCKMVHEKKKKTCLYTGYDRMDQIIPALREELDYLKIGRFDKQKGPLSSETTNQRMYKKVNGDWTDITSSFWPKEDLL